MTPERHDPRCAPAFSRCDPILKHPPQKGRLQKTAFHR
ncbi:hypothetical protein FTUN_8440 [Frigoriglobus tundricola]|uniref:Uncharacterized protein n=1 Tax=Frigoriglobus tundricola TaxID=2774151 RepID=A0A6M5Z5G5_9BACT|nr:hypothetical protein FTUN_8440 [Frigoriglobus tundricola]